MTIEELAKRWGKSVPNAILGKYYFIAVPQYIIRCTVSMLKPKKITVLQEYILKMVSVGVNSIEDISRFLGMSKNSVNNAVAKMSQEDLLIVNVKDATAHLTPSGHAAIDELNMIVPELVDHVFTMDGLTGEIRADRRNAYKMRELRAQGMTPITPLISAPNLMDISYEAVNRAITKLKKEYPSQAAHLEGELQRVTDIDSVEINYEKNALLVFVNENGELADLQVYGSSSLLTRKNEYETILSKMQNDGIKVVEADKKSAADCPSPEDSDGIWRNMIPTELMERATAEEATGAIEATETEARRIENDIQEIDERTLADPDEKDEELSRRRAELVRERDNLKEELAKQKSTRILSTYDHRPLLEQALQQAKQSVVIISPWIKASGMDYQIINLIRQAVRRGVNIVIGYGMSHNNDSDPDVVKKLENIANQPNSTLQIIPANNTHEKVLIMDDDFIVITSFNWMSFRGNERLGFRRETGIYTESKDVIHSMKQDISSRFNIALV